MGQFHLLTRRQIKPGGAPKRSFVSYQPNVRFAPIADIQPRFVSIAILLDVSSKSPKASVKR